MIHTINVRTPQKEVLLEITGEIRKIVQESGVKDGFCCIYTPHTTAAITINENADFSVSRDIIKGLASLGLERISFAHGEGNSPAHIKSSLVGCSETVFIEAGKLMLGTWQGIFLCEFDGPRNRTVLVKIM
ncbi:MAG: YjbQ family protein [Spirochaetes bacterium]|nr:MAG: YjbQ family protein [Spirochaetota bacterium]